MSADIARCPLVGRGGQPLLLGKPFATEPHHQLCSQSLKQTHSHHNCWLASHKKSCSTWCCVLWMLTTFLSQITVLIIKMQFPVPEHLAVSSGPGERHCVSRIMSGCSFLASWYPSDRLTKKLVVKKSRPCLGTLLLHLYDSTQVLL